MATFTYEDFRKAAESSGLLGSFSQADLNLAQKNPDAGMSILTAKKDWMNATTEEAKALANQRAEEIRSSFGEYTGGTDGSGFTLTPLSPNHFEYGDAPTYDGGSFGDQIKDLWDQSLNYGDFTYGDAPTYTSRYDQQIQDMIQNILNRPDFSYDPATDPLYQNYRKQYTREGQRATQDALGAAAAASGGLPSSYATTAASQAGNYYAAQMTDMIPELYQLAYNQYLNDYQMDLSDLGVVQGQESTDYNRYADQLAQYNTDRNFAYNVWADGLNRINSNLNTALTMDDLEWQRYLTELNQYNTDRNFAYGQLLDEIDSQTNERNEILNNAILAGEYGDYSQLNDLGINTDNNQTDWERRYQLAVLAAQYGDYSGLRALGINPQVFNYASGGSSGGGGGRGSSGGGGGGADDEITYDNLTNYPDKQVNDVMNSVVVAYPDKQIPDFDWNSLIKNGYNEAQLRAAGFVHVATPTQMNNYKHQLGSIPGLTQDNKVAMVQDWVRNGKITEAQGQELLAYIGY